MWIFGYGSLMWDGWEASHDCIARTTGDLSGYRRVFNKASTVNWGTAKLPGPTLNLEQAKLESCHGIAFEFPEHHRAALMTYLKKREGGFDFECLPVLLPDQTEVKAIAPIYRGKNLIVGKSIAEIADMADRASGTSGKCRDYVANIAKKLKQLGIDDPAVSALANALE